MRVSENDFLCKNVEKIEEKKRYVPPSLVRLDESMTQAGPGAQIDGPASIGSSFN